jgi:outer membrane protein insertion porin family
MVLPDPVVAPRALTSSDTPLPAYLQTASSRPVLALPAPAKNQSQVRSIVTLPPPDLTGSDVEKSAQFDAQTRRRLSQADTLKPSEIEIIQNSAKDPIQELTQEPTNDLKLTIPDQREIVLGAGIGYSSSEQLIGTVNARFLNALGKGRDLSATVGFGKTYRAVTLTESDRWFTPGGTSRSTSVWYRSDQPFYFQSDKSEFRSSSVGVSERFDIPLSAANSVFLAPGLEHDWLGTDNKTPDAYLKYIAKNGSALNVVTMSAGWTHDMRDSANLPTRGYITQTSAELGLGNAQYIKGYASARYYHPLWGQTVLSLSGMAGIGQGIGSKGYPLQKYFYAGGIGSVRGYATNSLGSRDFRTNVPLGGRKIAIGSVEAITPLPSFSKDIPGRPVWLAFVDAGNVWDSGLSGTDAGSLRASYGLGLGWQLPFGTLKLSAALPMQRHAGDDYQRFQFEFNAGF